MLLYHKLSFQTHALPSCSTPFPLFLHLFPTSSIPDPSPSPSPSPPPPLVWWRNAAPSVNYDWKYGWLGLSAIFLFFLLVCVYRTTRAYKVTITKAERHRPLQTLPFSPLSPLHGSVQQHPLLLLHQ